MKFKGIITALITPFYQGEIDKKSFVNLIHSGLQEGVDGFIINGTTAESPTLSEQEVEQIVKWAQAEVSGQVPLVLGIGHNSTKKALENLEKASQWKMDGALAVTPYYNKPSQEGLLKHFTKIAEASKLPVLLYNVPSRTQIKIEIPTILELAKKEMVVGVKEASGDLDFYSKLLSQAPSDFTITSGDDGTFLDLVERGGHGVISVISHFMLPTVKKFFEQALKKEGGSSSAFQKQYGKVVECVFKVTNPMMVKQILFHKKMIRSPELRLPLCEPSSSIVEEMNQLLKATSL